MNSIGPTHASDAVRPDLTTEQGRERFVVIEPLLRFAEGMHEHDRMRRAETPGFDDGGGSAMEKLIADRAEGLLVQCECVAEECESRRLAGRPIGQPVLYCRAKRLGDLAFHGNGNKLLACARQNPDIVL